jgi:TRAP-type mannitol/chloroaromatic compound transport system permease small subunit
MKFISKLLYVVDRFSVIIGKSCKYLILVILGIMLFEIISRYLFNSPTEWVVELSSYMFGVYFFLSGAYTLIRKQHVRMDILYIKWSRKVRKIADIVTFPLFAVYLGLFIYGGIGNIQYSLRNHEISNSLWGPQLAPIKIVIIIGTMLLLIQGIAILIRDIFIVFNKELPSVGEDSCKNNEEVKS